MGQVKNVEVRRHILDLFGQKSSKLRDRQIFLRSTEVENTLPKFIVTFGS